MRLASTISPSGTRLTTAATEVETVSSSEASRFSSDTPSTAAQRDHHADEPEQQAVEGQLERRARMAKRARLPGDSLGVAVDADRLDDVGAASLDGERARAHLLARAAAHRCGFAAQDRLVQRQPFGFDEPAVGDELVAGGQPDEVAGDDLVDVQGTRAAVAHHRGGRRHERGQPVERSLGAHLLGDADAVLATRIPRNSASRQSP